MKVLVTGAGGMLGTDVCEWLTQRNHQIVPTGRTQRDGFLTLDITDTHQVHRTLQQEQPDAVIHCAAWTDVDGAERTPDLAYAVNALGSWNIAQATQETGAWLLAVSTDFVFDGTKTTPYTEFDATNPLGVYGASKEVGERLIRDTLPGRHIIARTSWLFGVHGKNFPYTIRRLAQKLPEIPVVADQFGCPTHTWDLARKLVELAEEPLSGTYHICSQGECSWFEFAQAIVEKTGAKTQVVPITAQEYAERFGSPTKRPAYSPMTSLALKMRRKDDMPHWRDALEEFWKRAPE